MGLTINTAKNLLRQLVGLTGDSWLALSSTEPDPSGKGESGYNITEPPATDPETGHPTNYARTMLDSHFSDSDASFSDGLVDGVYTVSIKNIDEIHFQEALADWGNYRWFAIFEGRTGGNPKYVGELLKFVQDTTVNAENYTEKVEAGLYYFDNAQNDYIKITDEAFVEGKPYYIKDNSGIDIEEGTVPLVRTGYLKISVQ